MRTSLDERNRNRAIRSQLRKAIKEFHGINEKAEAEKRLDDVYSVIDRALKGGIIHKNKAARDKSRMTQFVRKLS